MTTFSAEGIPALVAPRILRPLVLAPIQCAFAAAASGNSSWPNQPARPDNDGIDPANVHFLDSFAEASLVVRVCRQGHPLVHAVTLIGHYLSVSCLYRREVVGREEFLGGLDRPSNEAPGFSGGAGDSSESFVSRLRNITPSQASTTAQRAEDFRSSSTRSCEVLRRVG